MFTGLCVRVCVYQASWGGGGGGGKPYADGQVGELGVGGEG